MTNFEAKKEQLALKKQKIKYNELNLKKKELAIQIRAKESIGEVAFQASIHHLGESTLLGAFLEINDRAKNEETVRRWASEGEKYLEFNNKNIQQPMIIKFLSSETPESKKIMKENKFRWNTFNGEWQGRGIKSAVEDLLKNHTVSIEVVKC